ncbi:MAG TPA: helix-turn-helix domain-containing protein [Hyphomicrobiaceae bacterium]|nr:helix-turn-helix domain-containing protein [Hyphomicrobiaceae bacterium]
MPNLTELGEQIKKNRRALKLTREELAKRAGVSRARIEALENLRASDIGFKNLLRILNAVGLDFRITALNQQRPTLEDLQAEEEEGETT